MWFKDDEIINLVGMGKCKLYIEKINRILMLVFILLKLYYKYELV